MDYRESAIRNILLSIALIGVGGFVITMGWHILACWRVPNEAMRKLFRVSLVRRCAKWFPILLLWVTGTIMVGGGGILSTSGWNQLDNHAQKHAMIVAVVRDWRMNNVLLTDCHFTVTEPNILTKYYLYPTFQVDTTRILRSSALFDPDENNDYDLLLALTKYEISVIKLQEVLDIVDLSLYAPLTGRKPLKEHQGVNDSSYVRQFLSAHNALGDLLKREYFEDWLKAGRDVRSD